MIGFHVAKENIGVIPSLIYQLLIRYKNCPTPNFNLSFNLKLMLTTLILICLNACSHMKTHEDLLKKGYALDSPSYFRHEELEKNFGKEWRNKQPPKVGLALAGGGTKASDFALGVLQGLEEAQVLKKVDIMSTVSGGGYAGLWYYSRKLELLNNDNKELFENYYQDCLPKKYAFNECKLNVPICPNENKTNFLGGTNDPYRYQNYLRGYQDVLSSGKDLFGNRAFNYETTNDKTKLTNDIYQLSFLTFGAAIVNLIPNILFDWEIPISPSRKAYATGIARTYGANPPVYSCTDDQNMCDLKNSDKSKKLGQWREEGDIKLANQITFDNLKSIHESGLGPMWIINSTAGEDRSPWDFTDPAHPEMTTFEFTPYGSGSGIYGYEHSPLFNSTSPFDAVVSSAAFFDSQQKSVNKFPSRTILTTFMQASTINWGVSYANPNASSFNKAFHDVLPWPLYYFHKFNAGEDSAYIHLSDGGMSENLGAYSLIRRGVPNLIISDHSYDRGGVMEDVCRLKNALNSQNPKLNDLKLYLRVPGLSDLDKVCDPLENADGNKRLGYDIFNWDYPILLGCISSTPDDECTNHDSGVSKSGYFARLFIIKPSIQTPYGFDENRNLGSKIKTVAEECWVFDTHKNDFTDSCKNEIVKNSSFITEKYFIPNGPDVNGNPWKYESAIPRELMGFLMNNSFKSEGINSSDGCPEFPQHSTVKMTFNSSPWLYGASRELGRYYARQLGWFFGAEADDKKLINRFNKAISYQSSHKMPTALATQGFLSLTSEKAGNFGDCEGLSKQ